MDKYEKLMDILRGLKKAAVCFSGGIDSFFLLYAAKEALGDENVMAVTLKTDFFAECDFERTLIGIKKLKVKHITVEDDLLTDENIRQNSKDRCFYCKGRMVRKALEAVRQYGFDQVVEGTNASDMADHQPSCNALAELGVKSPLLEAGLAKDEIISLLFKKGFFEVVRPPDACLACRVAVNEEITKEKLAMTEQAEDFIKIMGYQGVRVCYEAGNAVILIDKDEAERFAARHFKMVEKKLKELGYGQVRVEPR
jgi:uncharacterized protein